MSGFAFHMGSRAISFSSKKQQVVAFSIVKAEYIVVVSTQAVLLWRLLKELNQKQTIPTKIFCNNKLAICLTNDLFFHGRSKHIGIKFYYIHELVKENEAAVEFNNSLSMKINRLAFLQSHWKLKLSASWRIWLRCVVLRV